MGTSKQQPTQLGLPATPRISSQAHADLEDQDSQLKPAGHNRHRDCFELSLRHPSIILKVTPLYTYQDGTYIIAFYVQSTTTASSIGTSIGTSISISISTSTIITFHHEQHGLIYTQLHKASA